MLDPEELLDIGLAAKTAEWWKARGETRTDDEWAARELAYAQAAAHLDRTLQGYLYACQQFVKAYEQLKRLVEITERQEKTLIQAPPFERTN